MSARLSVLLILLGIAPGRAEELPLFSSAEHLEVTIESQLNTVVRQRSRRPEVPGVLHYEDADGTSVAVPMTMTTRGHSRLEMCQFPPLSVTFRNKDAKTTIFAGQKKLKIVTRCNRGERFEQYLWQEYGIYRAFNVLSDYSFRVRQMQVTYVDTEGKRRTEVHPAFLIESIDEVAGRNGMERVDANSISPARLDPAHESLFSLFQFLIANTDWSDRKGPGDEECCHNGKAIRTPGTEEGWMVLPYDFDQAGLINTAYALPDERLGIRSVRQRLFRGRCRNLDRLDETVTMFNEGRAEIEAALLPEAVDGRPRRSALRFIDEFYEIINDPEETEKKILKRCLKG